MAEQVVIVNFTRLGDFIQSSPLLRKISNAHPHARITMLVYDAFAEAAARLPMVDDVLPLRVDELVAALDTRGKLAQAYQQLLDLLRHPALIAPDLLFNLSHTPLAATLCGMIAARHTLGLRRNTSRRLSINGNWFNYLFSVMQERTLNPFNLVEIYAGMYEPRKPIPPLAFEIEPSDRHRAEAILRAAQINATAPIIALQPGASTPSRQWPPAYFAELARRLAEIGRQCVIVGSSAEQPLAQRIHELSGRRAVSIAGSTSLGELAAVLERCEKLVSNDTGTIHLAAALGVPTVGIYIGPAAAKDTAPYGDGHFVLEPDLSCAPCGYHEQCANLQCGRQIDVAHVLPLVALPAAQAEKAAAGLLGVRVFRTGRKGTGAVVLTPMNSPRTGNSVAMLNCYRRFWNELLNDDDQSEAARTDAYSELLDEQASAALRSVAATAQTAQAQIKRQFQAGAQMSLDLPKLLREHLIWQDQLREIGDRYPAIGPFTRFLLVRTGTVCSDSLAEYVDAMAQTVALLRRGTDMLGAWQPITNRSAVACASAG